MCVYVKLCIRYNEALYVHTPPNFKFTLNVWHLRFSGMWNTILTLIVQCVMPDLESRFKAAALENWFVGRAELSLGIVEHIMYLQDCYALLHRIVFALLLSRLEQNPPIGFDLFS